MCMKLSLFARKKIAKEPITCYKVVGVIPQAIYNAPGFVSNYLIIKKVW